MTKAVRCVECGKLIDVKTKNIIIEGVDVAENDIDTIGLVDRCPYCRGNDQINKFGEDIRNSMTWRF